MALRKVLIVVDDADDVTQLDALLPLHEPLRPQLHPESLVIITSRNKNVLNARCIIVSEVQLLPEGCNLDFFEAWAFATGRPDWNTSELVPKVVACCGRLPLILKVGLAYILSSGCMYALLHRAWLIMCMRLWT